MTLPASCKVAACQHMSHLCRGSSRRLTLLILIGSALCWRHRPLPSSKAGWLHLAAYSSDVSLQALTCMLCMHSRQHDGIGQLLPFKGGHSLCQPCWRRGCTL